jgi:hypothetical protein
MLAAGINGLVFWADGESAAAAFDWIPCAFAIGGLLAMYWDQARGSKAIDPRWYRAWLVGLALSVVGLLYTIWYFATGGVIPSI